MSTAIRFEQVSKSFILQHERSRSLQELMLNLLQGKKNGSREKFWGLQDVSFEIKAGETVGLIGPNGVGKSTLLKLVARILRPTSGKIYINGRVSALLELGSGFHPDMTGRENIYLNGSILGLNQAQTRRKLDEIVAFAELERFIDLPVKHYSSGMYVRLGFAVAVHTEPDILLIDEVLAVGDAAFQRKCLERIADLRQQGVTILLVSHSLDAVRQICRRAIWVNLGQIIADGVTEAVVSQYLWHSYKTNEVTPDSQGSRWGNGDVTIEQVRLLNGNGEEERTFLPNQPFTIQLHYHAKRRIERPVFGFAIHGADGTHVTGPNTRFDEHEIPWIEGRGTVEYTLRRLPLLGGTYYLSVVACDWEMDMADVFDYHNQLYPFRVSMPESGERYGLVALKGDWQSTSAGAAAEVAAAIPGSRAARRT